MAEWLMRQWLHRGPVIWLLWPLHMLMRTVVAARRRAYQHGWLRSQALPVPVVVVGNRVVGGAGKTPTVIAVVEHLRSQGWSPGVLSRGHGRHQGTGSGTGANTQAPLLLDAAHATTLDARQVGDEPWLIWRRTGAPMGIGRLRHAAGQALLAAHPQIDILVCDDGLQHLALARQIELVVFDARGAGNGLLLPAGPLREPIDSPPGPGCALSGPVLYNAALASTPLPGHLAQRQLLPPVPFDAWWAGEPQTKASALDAPARPVAVPRFDAATCWAVAGIAQPQRFFEALRELGLGFTPCPLPDHAPLDPLPWPEHLPHVLMTEKDAVKLSPERLAQQRPHTQVWVLPMTLHPEPGFWLALDARLATLAQPVHNRP